MNPVIRLIPAIILSITSGWCLLHLLCREKAKQQLPVIIAHRGAAGLAPENTLAAVKAGLAQNAAYIEVDVQRTADGILLLMHDETINRTTNGRGAVRDLSWSEMCQLDAGSYYTASFSGEAIPTLVDTLASLQDKMVTLVIEIKDPHFYPGISKQIVELVGQYNDQEKVIVISFDPAALRTVHQLAPEIRTGSLITWPWQLNVFSSNQVVDVYWLSVLLDPTFIRRMHWQGYDVWVWTINSPVLMRLLGWLGVDGITTDHPQRFQK